MSMRGEIISKEYQKQVIISDADGKQYSCYAEDVAEVNGNRRLTEEQKTKCMDLSLVLGDSW